MGAAVTNVAEEAFTFLDAATHAALPACHRAGARRRARQREQAVGGYRRAGGARELRARPARERRTGEGLHRAPPVHRGEEDGVVRVRPVHEALLRVWPMRCASSGKRRADPGAPHARADGRRMDSPEDKAKPDYLVTSPALLAGAAQLAERLGDDLPARCANSSTNRSKPMPGARHRKAPTTQDSAATAAGWWSRSRSPASPARSGAPPIGPSVASEQRNLAEPRCAPPLRRSTSWSATWRASSGTASGCRSISCAKPRSRPPPAGAAS